MSEYLYKINNDFESKKEEIINSKVRVQESTFSVFLFIGDKCVLVEIDEEHYTSQCQIIYLFTT